MAARTSVILGVAVVTVVAFAGCSSSSHRTAPPSAASATTTTPATRPPMTPGPAAVLSGPVTGGKGISLLGGGPDLVRAGYTNTEYFAAGTAQSFKSVGPQGTDGRWTVTPNTHATYKTRIVVHVPIDPKKFNGTLLVEWLNVSSGTDTAPDFQYAGSEITRAGFGWVGVSAQQIGVSGGTGVVPVAGLPTGGLRGIDPARYGSLHHPGDQYALDIFSQVARALRVRGAVDALGPLRPQRFIAIGESQSAFQLTTYIDAIQPTAHIFDGFFVHSRGGGAIPIAGGGISTGIAGGIHIRTDLDVPVFLFETETDEAQLRYYNARQPDSNSLRLWDVAGASHADAYVLGGNANALPCNGEINTAPTHYVVSAAIAALDRWVRTGTPPPSAPRMDVALVKGAPVVQRDALGNAIGGVRTAANNVPVAALSGVATDTSNILCALFGSTHPFTPATLVRLYGTKANYLARFARATDQAIANGYLLPADRADVLADGSLVSF